MKPTINELFQRAVSGNSEDRERLFECLSDRFHLFLRLKQCEKRDAEEIAQNALATVAEEFEKLNITVSFSAWAHKVLENRFLHHLQSSRRREARSAPLDEEAISANPKMIDPDLKMRLLHCLEQVALSNRRYARILNLHQIGYSREEICQKLGMTVNQSYVVMSRARAMLRQCLDNGGRSE